jgi:hypothetical protein
MAEERVVLTEFPQVSLAEAGLSAGFLRSAGVRAAVIDPGPGPLQPGAFAPAAAMLTVPLSQAELARQLLARGGRAGQVGVGDDAAGGRDVPGHEASTSGDAAPKDPADGTDAPSETVEAEPDSGLPAETGLTSDVDATAPEVAGPGVLDILEVRQSRGLLPPGLAVVAFGLVAFATGMDTPIPELAFGVGLVMMVLGLWPRALRHVVLDPEGLAVRAGRQIEEFPRAGLRAEMVPGKGPVILAGRRVVLVGPRSAAAHPDACALTEANIRRVRDWLGAPGPGPAAP